MQPCTSLGGLQVAGYIRAATPTPAERAGTRRSRPLCRQRRADALPRLDHGFRGTRRAVSKAERDSAGLSPSRVGLGDVGGVSASGRPVASVGGTRVSPPVEVPEDILERIRTLCLALPEVTVRVDTSLSRSRSTAYSFDIRRRSFCLLVARESSTGKLVTLLVLRADPDEREALLAIGHPFFASRSGRDRIVVLVSSDTDWAEIRELVTESYRTLAPKKLTALLD